MLGFGKKITPQQKAVQDVQTVIERTRYPLLRAAWGEYRRIKRMSDTYDNLDQGENLYTTPEWFGLHKLIAYGGDFNKFDLYELYILRSLKTGYTMYDETMHVLMDHHDDEKEAQYLFAAHPSLSKHVPPEFNNSRQVIKVLVEVTNQYRHDMEDFSGLYAEKIDEAIVKIVKAAAKKIG